MTAATLNNPYQLLVTGINTGSSPEARALEMKCKNLANYFLTRPEPDFRFRSELERAFSELASAIKTGERDNWDQYGATKIDYRTCELAYLFINALPSSIPVPEVGLDPDGEISFEWIVSRDKQFSVSLSPVGLLSYAGVFGNNSTAHGTEQFDDQVPQAIISAVRRLGFRR